MTLFLTCAYKRPEIFSIFLYNIPNRYFLVVAGDTHDPCKEIFDQEKRNGIYLEIKNRPLGEKWNTALKSCKSLDFEYLFITGSDDIYQPELLKYYDSRHEDYIGLLDIYFHDFQKTKYCPGFVHDRKGEPHGAGRRLSRKVLDRLNWQLWDNDLNSGLDASMSQRLHNFAPDISKHFINLKQKGFWAVDLKTKDCNLHQMEEYNGVIVTDMKFELV